MLKDKRQKSMKLAKILEKYGSFGNMNTKHKYPAVSHQVKYGNDNKQISKGIILPFIKTVTDYYKHNYYEYDETMDSSTDCYNDINVLKTLISLDLVYTKKAKHSNTVLNVIPTKLGLRVANKLFHTPLKKLNRRHLIKNWLNFPAAIGFVAVFVRFIYLLITFSLSLNESLILLALTTILVTIFHITTHMDNIDNNNCGATISKLDKVLKKSTDKHTYQKLHHTLHDDRIRVELFKKYV